MPKINLNTKDREGNIKSSGYIEIKNQTEENAELYFYGDIVSDSWNSYWTDEDKCPQDISDFLKTLDKYKNIDIFINSGGGSVFAGIAIYSMLKRHKGKKIVHVDGLAASIASVIALAGDEVVIPKYANFMIHNPLCVLWDAYNANDLRKVINALDGCKESILNIYMENVKEGITREELSNLMDEETWFTGDEAQEYFNITVEESEEIAACDSNFFNKYRNTPKILKENEEKENHLDCKKIADVVIKTLNDEKIKKEEKLKEEKEKILNDLDLI